MLREWFLSDSRKQLSPAFDAEYAGVPRRPRSPATELTTIVLRRARPPSERRLVEPRDRADEVDVEDLTVLLERTAGPACGMIPPRRR